MDHIIRALAYDGKVRVSAVISTDTVEELRRRHNTTPVATAALGRTVSGALLLSWGLKGEGLLTLRVFGDGPLGGIIVTANADYEVRGYVQNPDVDLPLNPYGKLDVGGAVGAGHLYVTKDIGLREAYTGSTVLVNGEIGDDLSAYLMQSEQTPSVVSVGVLVDTDHHVLVSGGLVIQLMPDCEEEILAEIEANLPFVEPISQFLQKKPSLQALVDHYLPHGNTKILEEHPVCFACTCNREKIAGLITGLGPEEIADMAAKDKGCHVTCHFCNEDYDFTEEELQAFLQEL